MELAKTTQRTKYGHIKSPAPTTSAAFCPAMMMMVPCYPRRSQWPDGPSFLACAPCWSGILTTAAHSVKHEDKHQTVRRNDMFPPQGRLRHLLVWALGMACLVNKLRFA